MAKRVLVFGMTENPGGIESFLYNYYSHIDREKLQFDFLCNSKNPVAYEDELIALGARTFHITARRESRKLFYRDLDKLFAQFSNEWVAIWMNVCSLANIDYLKIAKKHGIKRRIIHSHNSMNMDGKLRGALHHINKQLIEKYATDFWACSESAATWFYPPQLLKRSVIIHNAIDVEKLKFDEAKRVAIREQIGAKKEDYVVGNIGRLHFQKNQKFALEIFKEFLKKVPSSKMVFVGDGEDRGDLEKTCRELKIKDNVIFTGVQHNIDAWLSAFDVFLFPSLFEGQSVVALEAQANGVPVLASSTVISNDMRINDNFVCCDLESGSKVWANSLIEIMMYKGRAENTKTCHSFCDKGYEISGEAKKIEIAFVN